MEVSGFVRISSNGTGRFQFGLVSGDIDGRVNNAAKLHVLSSPGSDRMKTIRFAAGVGPLSKMTSCKATSICIWLTIRLFGPSRVNSVTHEPIKHEKTDLGRSQAPACRPCPTAIAWPDSGPVRRQHKPRNNTQTSHRYAAIGGSFTTVSSWWQPSRGMGGRFQWNAQPGVPNPSRVPMPTCTWMASCSSAAGAARSGGATKSV